MRRKGISPLIAAVLLIAFTMAVASLFAQWAPQLVQDAQGDTQQQAQDIQECSDRTIEITDADASSATIQQTGGNQGVGNISVTWFYTNENPAQGQVQITSQRGVNETTEGSSSGDLDRVEADPLNCPGAPSATY